MARDEPVDRGGMFIPVILNEPIQPGRFEFALDHLVDHELDLSALDARFCNDATGDRSLVAHDGLLASGACLGTPPRFAGELCVMPQTTIPCAPGRPSATWHPRSRA